jgi:hypothetical protein
MLSAYEWHMQLHVREVVEFRRGAAITAAAAATATAVAAAASLDGQMTSFSH